jgi:HEAT repeat protein
MTDETNPHVLIERLGEKDTTAAMRTAVALSKLGAAAVEPLLDALHHNNPAIRAGAVRTLGWIRDPRAVQLLLNVMCRDDSEDVRLLAQWALVNIGEAVIEPLIRLLPSPEECLWVYAAEALAKFGDPAVEPLIAALGDERPQVRMVAATVLGHIGDLRAVEPLIALLQDPDPGVQQEATAALSDMAARINDADLRRKVARALVDTLGSDDANVHAALRQLSPWLKT